MKAGKLTKAESRDRVTSQASKVGQWWVTELSLKGQKVVLKN
jgi:hypothetical protein